jgi:hypothetical protein
MHKVRPPLKNNLRKKGWAYDSRGKYLPHKQEVMTVPLKKIKRKTWA